MPGWRSIAGGSLLPQPLPRRRSMPRSIPADSAGDHAGDFLVQPADHHGREHRRQPHRAENLAVFAGVGLVSISGGQVAGGAECRPICSSSPPMALNLDDLRSTISNNSLPTPPRAASTAPPSPTPSTPTTSCKARRNTPTLIILTYRNGAPVRLSLTSLRWSRKARRTARAGKLGPDNIVPLILVNVQRQPGASMSSPWSTRSRPSCRFESQAGLPSSVDPHSRSSPTAPAPSALLGRQPMWNSMTMPWPWRWWCW